MRDKRFIVFGATLSQTADEWKLYAQMKAQANSKSQTKWIIWEQLIDIDFW